MTEQSEITITAEQIEKIKKRIDRNYEEMRKAEEQGRRVAEARREGVAMGLEYVLFMLGIEY